MATRGKRIVVAADRQMNGTVASGDTTLADVSHLDAAGIFPDKDGQSTLVEFEHFQNCTQSEIKALEETLAQVKTTPLEHSSSPPSPVLGLVTGKTPSPVLGSSSGKTPSPVLGSSAGKTPSPTRTGAVLNNSTKSESTVRRITLADYRKQVGIAVHGRDSKEKIGIKTSPQLTVTEQNTASPLVGDDGQKDEKCPPNKGVLCNRCGYTSEFYNKCSRCGRGIIQGKIVHIPVSASRASPVDKPSPPVTPSRPVVYGPAKIRRIRTAKEVEPQCVTLSSDEDEAGASGDKASEAKTPCEPEAKKPRSENCGLTPNIERMSVNTKDNSCTPDDTEMDGDEQVATVDESDLKRWQEAGFTTKRPHPLTCRVLHIGTYATTPASRVLFSGDGMLIEAYRMQTDGRVSNQQTSVAISKPQILKMDVNFGAPNPALFLCLSPKAAKEVRNKFNMMIANIGLPYYDVTSSKDSEKRLILIPQEPLNEHQQSCVKKAFVTMGVFNEVTTSDAADLLKIIASPKPQPPLDLPAIVRKIPHRTTIHLTPNNGNGSTTNKENASRVEVRVTRTKGVVKAIIPPVKVEPMFTWSDVGDQVKFTVSTEDYTCLNEDELLNDNIIDFYLSYAFSTKLNEAQKSRIYVFSSFFYQRLTSRAATSLKKHPIEDDPKVSAAEKRHQRVKSWTKKVDIFDKDYLIIPINEHSHWFLAIICFPGMAGPVNATNNAPLPQSAAIAPKPNPAGKGSTTPKITKLVSTAGQSFLIGSTTITPVANLNKAAKAQAIPIYVKEENPVSDKDEAESDEELSTDAAGADDDAKEQGPPVKQPCILIFDSLSGSSRARVIATLRDYLCIEYRIKKSVSPGELFTRECMKGCVLKVPQQNNYSDCGIYVLQYAESFMEAPFTDYRIPMASLRDWFPSQVTARKRRDIQQILSQLTRETNSNWRSVMELLDRPAVRVEDPLKTENPNVGSVQAVDGAGVANRTVSSSPTNGYCQGVEMK